MDADLVEQLIQKLARIESAVTALVSQRMVKDWYTTAEAARLLDRSEWTVREWCRLGRVRADKRRCGRGNAQEWIVSHEELQRIRNEGLLPQSYRHVR